MEFYFNNTEGVDSGEVSPINASGDLHTPVVILTAQITGVDLEKAVEYADDSKFRFRDINVLHDISMAKEVAADTVSNPRVYKVGLPEQTKAEGYLLLSAVKDLIYG